MLNDATASALRRQLGADSFSELAELFFNEYGDRLKRIEAFVADDNRVGLEVEAYKLLGAAANIGLESLSREAETVARNAMRADWDELKEGLVHLRRIGEASRQAVSDATGRTVSRQPYPPFSWEPWEQKKTRLE